MNLYELLKSGKDDRKIKKWNVIKTIAAGAAILAGFLTCIAVYNSATKTDNDIQTQARPVEARKVEKEATKQNDLERGADEGSAPQEREAKKTGLEPCIPYYEITEREAKKTGLEPHLLSAQQKQESGFNPIAKSRAGAVGISQFMPATANDLGYSIGDMLIPEKAIEAQARYMKQLYNMPLVRDFPVRERMDLALACYNAGYGNIKDAIKIIEAANKGQEKYDIKRGKKTRSVDISSLRGLPHNWQGFSKALVLVTGEKNSKETRDYVEKIRKYYQEYSELAVASANI